MAAKKVVKKKPVFDLNKWFSFGLTILLGLDLVVDWSSLDKVTTIVVSLATAYFGKSAVAPAYSIIKKVLGIIK